MLRWSSRWVSSVNDNPARSGANLTCSRRLKSGGLRHERRFDIGETYLIARVGFGPLQREVRNFFPALLPYRVMRAVGKFAVVGDGRGILDVLAQVPLVDCRRDDVILAAGDEQQRRAIALAVVDLRRRVGIQKSKGSIPENAVRGRNLISVIDFLRFSGIELVGEGVVELTRSKRRSRAVAEWISQNWESHANRGERQHRYSGRLRRVDENSSGAEAAVDEHLHDEPTERMAHDDWRRLELANNALVVIDDRFDLETLERRWVFSDRFDFALEPGPRRREHVVPCLLVAVDPLFPAARSEPKPVNQYDGWFVGAASVGAHVCLSLVGACRDQYSRTCGESNNARCLRARVSHRETECENEKQS